MNFYDRSPVEQSKMSEKIHKVLADRNLGSRRKMERWVIDGRVHVNSEVATLGQRVSESDVIEVDGKRIPYRQSQTHIRIIVMNKDVGEIVTRNDPENRPTVFTRLPSLHHDRWIAIGRLDFVTSGLLLFTNHGLLAHRLMHPSSGIDREYAVRIFGKLDQTHRQMMLDGIVVDGHRLRFTDVQYYSGGRSNHWYHVVLMEGRNREVRQLFHEFGYTVSRLKRVRFGPIVLPKGLKRGQFRELPTTDVFALCKWLRVVDDTSMGHLSQTKSTESFLIPYPGLDAF
ncbi:MAG: rRNA pseudouridine synthase [Gammaproteobacteria bacterium]|nr:rRNA pseudouridine synthase [Gammaproteobacteria bacterium]MYF52990.1 rRNA pseudouridine synthase [Gammaproteobacteria bacterium]MYK44012.1 rRNA pseudouridine synthase [Gammaproteobacteria bacterium]